MKKPLSLKYWNIWYNRPRTLGLRPDIEKRLRTGSGHGCALGASCFRVLGKTEQNQREEGQNLTPPLCSGKYRMLSCVRVHVRVRTCVRAANIDFQNARQTCLRMKARVSEVVLAVDDFKCVLSVRNSGVRSCVRRRSVCETKRSLCVITVKQGGEPKRKFVSVCL